MIDIANFAIFKNFVSVVTITTTLLLRVDMLIVIELAAC